MNAAVAHKHEETQAAPAVEAEAVNPLATAEPAALKDPRRKSSFDTDTGIITVEEPNKPTITFDTGKLSPKMASYALQLGAWTFARGFADVNEGFAKLMAEEIPETKMKVENVSPWKMAVAHAIVHEQKQAGEEWTLAQAVALVKDMDRKAIEQARLNPTVVHYYNQLNSKADKPAASSVMALAAKA